MASAIPSNATARVFNDAGGFVRSGFNLSAAEFEYSTEHVKCQLTSYAGQSEVFGQISEKVRKRIQP